VIVEFAVKRACVLPVADGSFLLRRVKVVGSEASSELFTEEGGLDSNETACRPYDPKVLSGSPPRDFPPIHAESA
jgi:hypothetical protein